MILSDFFFLLVFVTVANFLVGFILVQVFAFIKKLL